jgi:hypothetical protein
MKKKKGSPLIGVALSSLLIVIFVLSSCASEANKNEQNVIPGATVGVRKPIIDSTKFSGITADQLKVLIGKEDSVEKWKFSSGNGKKYEATTYTYDQGNKEFLVIDGKVVRFTYYGTDQTYDAEKDLFSMFGITPGENITKVADTGVALKYHLVSDKIGEFWLISDGKKSIDTVKITYNLNYFE